MHSRKIKMSGTAAAVAILLMMLTCEAALLTAVATPLWSLIIFASWTLGGVCVWVSWAQSLRCESLRKRAYTSFRDPLCWLVSAVFGPFIGVLLFSSK